MASALITFHFFSVNTQSLVSLTAALFENHDKTQFEVVHYPRTAFRPKLGTQKRIAGAVEGFIDLQNKGDAQIAQVIRRLEIDINIDLNGFTRDARCNVLARRVAPLQVSYLGYPGTMGTDYIDYVIADSTIIPKEQFPHYSECVVWLPDSYQVNDQQQHIPGMCQLVWNTIPQSRALCFVASTILTKFHPRYSRSGCGCFVLINTAFIWLIEAHPKVSRNHHREANETETFRRSD